MYVFPSCVHMRADHSAIYPISLLAIMLVSNRESAAGITGASGSIFVLQVRSSALGAEAW